MKMKKILIAFGLLAGGLLQATVPARLQNIGNSCFMNAALQCTYNMNDLTNLLLTKQDWYNQGTTASAYIDFIKKVQLKQPGVMNPGAICERGWAMFPERAQQDASEFLVFLLDHLINKDIKASTRERLRQYEDKSPRSDISDLFCPLLHQDVMPAGEPMRRTIVHQTLLQLPLVQGDRKLNHCLDHFFSETMPEGSRKRLKSSFAETPQYVILSLNRKTYGKDPVTQKYKEDRLADPISFPLRGLDFAPYFTDPTKSKGTYDLIGIIAHSGSAIGGHYTAYVLVGNQWYYCNDSHIEPVGNDIMETIAQSGVAPHANVPTTFFYELSTKRKQRAAQAPPALPQRAPITPAVKAAQVAAPVVPIRTIVPSVGVTTPTITAIRRAVIQRAAMKPKPGVRRRRPAKKVTRRPVKKRRITAKKVKISKPVRKRVVRKPVRKRIVKRRPVVRKKRPVRKVTTRRQRKPRAV